MSQIDQEALHTVQTELLSNETILWTGRPKTSVIFHKQDGYLIPFSLLWGGFAIFWEAGVAGYWGNTANTQPSYFMMLWGIPFIVIGQYFIWGRFFVAAWKKQRTFYVVSNQRVIVIQNGRNRKVASAYLDSLATLIKENSSGGTGTLRFAPMQPIPMQPIWSQKSGWGMWDGMSMDDVPVFRDIEDLDLVYHLVSKQRETLRAAKSISF